MRFSLIASLALVGFAAAVPRRHHHAAAAAASSASSSIASSSTSSAVAAASAAVASGSVTRGSTTEVFFEVNGVPGNECLTFRNNGEIVDAACVDDSADRQITPSTLNGQDVLLVQRTFTADFRPDLVDVDACIGNNGTDFLALPCDSISDFVSVSGDTLVSTSGACQSGHDDAAQITIDSTGQNCATFTTTTVTPVTD